MLDIDAIGRAYALGSAGGGSGLPYQAGVIVMSFNATVTLSAPARVVYSAGSLLASYYGAEFFNTQADGYKVLGINAYATSDALAAITGTGPNVAPVFTFSSSDSVLNIGIAAPSNTAGSGVVYASAAGTIFHFVWVGLVVSGPTSPNQ